MLTDGCHNEERIIRSPPTATQQSEQLLLANIHSNGRSCFLAGLKVVGLAAAILTILASGADDDDDDNDVIHFAFLFLFEDISNVLKKCLTKGDDDVVSTANVYL